MISFLFKFVKRIVFASILIYSFDVFATSLNLVIPVNIFTVLLVSFFDIPALICLILFSFAF